MANITIVRQDAAISVNFGVYYPSDVVTYIEVCYQQSNFDLIGNAVSHIDIKFSDQEVFKVGIVQEDDNYVIDSVDGVAPTSINHLFELLKMALG